MPAGRLEDYSRIHPELLLGEVSTVATCKPSGLLAAEHNPVMGQHPDRQREGLIGSKPVPLPAALCPFLN